MRHLKLLPGTMLILLASTFSINPVSAQQTPASGTGETQNQMDMNTPQTPTRTNTQPVPTPMQMEGQTTPSSTPIQRQVVPSSTQPTTNTISGTIQSIEGEVITLAMADGMTKQMKVSSADLQRLSLREGMEISATVDAQSMASNITLAQANTTTINNEATRSQVGGTSTTTEATTTTTTEAEASSEPTTTTENTSTTTESAPASRPVRALW